MTIRTSSFSGGLPRLAPDLAAPTTWAGQRPSITITGINPSAALTTVLSITGEKGVINYSYFDNMTAENYTVKLTVDGSVIYNDVWAVANTAPTFNGAHTTSSFYTDPIYYSTSFLLEIQSTTDTSIDYTYTKRVLL